MIQGNLQDGSPAGIKKLPLVRHVLDQGEFFCAANARHKGTVSSFCFTLLRHQFIRNRQEFRRNGQIQPPDDVDWLAAVMADIAGGTKE